MRPWVTPPPGGLSRRLLRFILLFSLGFTLLAGVVQLGIEYRREMQAIEARFELIRLGYVAGIERSLWDFNREQLETLLRGLADFPDIGWVRLIEADFDMMKGQLSTGPTARIERFALHHRLADGEVRALGSLEVGVDLRPIHRRLYLSGLGNLLWMGAFVGGLSIALLWLFHRLVTRHLLTMAAFSRQLADGRWQQPLRLAKRRRRARDEIDAVASALDEMRQAILDDRRRQEADHLALQDRKDELERKVAQRTASLHRAKEQAEAANEAKSRFLATMSHELRTPLSGILGMAELLAEAPMKEPDRRRLRALHKAGEGLLAILNDLLDFAKLEEGEARPTAVDFSLPELVDEVVALLESRARDHGTRLESRLDPRVASGHRAPEQFLRQVLTNLLANAIKFTAHGRVTLTVDVLEDDTHRQRLRLLVEDDGVGIPLAMQERIFDRFVQADERASRRGGAGLGLAICKRLVAAMGGDIRLTSREGEGSRFWFDIWLERSGADAAMAGETTPLVPGRQLDLLVVEDVALNREVARGLLEREGHRVELVENARQALARCQARHFDLIMLDVQLPDMNGTELCRRIRHDQAGKNGTTPIYAFTASLQPARVQRYLDVGMQGVIAKPIRLAALRQTLAGVSRVPMPEEPDVALDPGDAFDSRVLEAHARALGEQKLATLLERLGEDLQAQESALMAALQARDCAELATRAHRLAGASAALGARPLAEALRRLEASAEAEDADACTAQGEPLQCLLETTGQAIVAALNRLTAL